MMLCKSLVPVLAAGFALGLSAVGAGYAQPPVGEVIVRAPARAPAGTEVRQETVKYSDLDLNGAAGAETLIGRIRGAADRVCAPAPHHLGRLKDVADYRSCRSGAMKRAVEDLGKPMVSQVFERTGA